MAEGKTNIKVKVKSENKKENCSRLDFNCCLDGNGALVKKQYGCMDRQGGMDKGMMLQ